MGATSQEARHGIQLKLQPLRSSRALKMGQACVWVQHKCTKHSVCTVCVQLSTCHKTSVRIAGSRGAATAQRTLVAASGAAVLLSRRSMGAGSPWGGPGARRDTPEEMR